MTALQIHRENMASGVTLRLEGTLDGRTALLLHRSLQEMGPADVVLDFGRLREFKDTAVAVLTGVLSDQRVRVRGLAEHQERMFRYFGVPTGSARPAYYTPEDVLSA